MTTALVLKKANPDTLPAMQRFLTGMKLPVNDLPADLSGFTLAFDEEELVGTAGMELMGRVGLLRSVAVAETHRDRQLGRQLFAAALDHARANGVQEVFLITDSAAAYFEKNGFQRVDRSEAPLEIAGTAQFSGLCPSSAVVMKRVIA
jgi:amino-acid N-acetyltransferase